MHWANLHQAGSTATTTLRPYVPVPQENVEPSGGETGSATIQVFLVQIFTHTHTHSQYSAESVSIAFRLAYGNRQTHTQDCNPRCACTLMVNKSRLKYTHFTTVYSIQIL